MAFCLAAGAIAAAIPAHAGEQAECEKTPGAKYTFTGVCIYSGAKINVPAPAGPAGGSGAVPPATFCYGGACDDATRARLAEEAAKKAEEVAKAVKERQERRDREREIQAQEKAARCAAAPEETRWNPASRSYITTKSCW